MLRAIVLTYGFAAWVLLMCALPPARAELVVSLGVEDTSHNDPSVRVAPNTLPSLTGQTAPFDGNYIGSDISGPNFSADWTFNYTLGPSTTVIGASFYLQIYDADAAGTSGRPIGKFTINGVDLTAALNDQFALDPLGTTNTNKTGNLNKETLSLPSSMYASLEAGSAITHLELTGPGWGVLGSTTYNAAFLQYSKLDLQTSSIPEPSTFIMLLGGLAVTVGWRSRKRAA
jgi:hypothetical protein